MSTHRSPPTQFRNDPPEPAKRSFGGRISLRLLSRFCHNVGTGLHAGVDVRRIFENESVRGSMRHRTKLTEIRDHISRGGSLSEAFAGAYGYFPPMLCEMIEVGERTGRLEQIFLRMGEYYDHLLKLRRNFLIGIAWPMIELTIAILVIGAFILIVGMIADPPPMTFMGLYGPEGAMIYFGVIGLIVAGIGGAIFAAGRGWISVDPLFRLLMNVPFIGRGLQNVALSRLTWALALATDSDLPADRATELAVRTTQNSYYTRFIDGMKNVIARGRSMHEAFASTGVYPDEFLDSLETGEIAGRISETMQITASEYEDRTKAFFRTLTIVAGVLVFLGVAGLIIYMIFSMAMQYIGILNNAVEGNF